MAKQDKLIQARNDGMLMAYKIAKENGIEELENELKYRNITKINTPLTRTQLEDIEKKFKKQVIRYYSAAVFYILKEKFGYGKVRLKRFHDHFDDLCDSVIRDYLSLEDIITYLNEEYGINLLYDEEE